MDVRVFSPVELACVARALRNIALSDHQFSEEERALLEGIIRIHEVELAIETLEPIAFEEVARVLVDPQRRKRAVQLAIVMSLVEGTPSRRAEQRVSEFARALGIEERGLAVLSQISHGHALLARFDMLRRFSGFIRRAEGFPGFWKVAPAMLGIGGGNPDLAARYRALEHCTDRHLRRAHHRQRLAPCIGPPSVRIRRSRGRMQALRATRADGDARQATPAHRHHEPH